MHYQIALTLIYDMLDSVWWARSALASGRRPLVLSKIPYLFSPILTFFHLFVTYFALFQHLFRYLFWDFCHLKIRALFIYLQFNFNIVFYLRKYIKFFVVFAMCKNCKSFFNLNNISIFFYRIY